MSELKSQMTNPGKEAWGHILAQQTGARGKEKEEVKANPEEILEGKAACTELVMVLFVTCSFPNKCLLSSWLEDVGGLEELFEITLKFLEGFKGLLWLGKEITSPAVVRGRAEGCAPRWLQFCWLLDKLG